jgi:ubiquinone/menaquinone biosynthesis C-methylase UbiE
MKDESPLPGNLSLIFRPSAYFDAFRQRSEELEHIDKGDYSPDEYERCMVELRRVNRFLGDAAIWRRELRNEAVRLPLSDFSVLDVGAGTGELLRVAARWARKTGRRANMVGLELNARSAEGIIEESKNFSEVRSVRGDALRLPFKEGSFDFVICSLFTHHFTDDNVVSVLRELCRVASRRVFVIDLYRHPLAYFLYTTVGHLLFHNRLLREDGALSILRSFRPVELQQLAMRAQLKNIRVQRRFPFRLVLSASGSSEEIKI